LQAVFLSPAIAASSSKLHLADTQFKLREPDLRHPSSLQLMPAFHRIIFLAKPIAPWLAAAYTGLLTLMLPLSPLCASLVFGRWKYLRDYSGFIRRMRVHIGALREGPARHYFEDVMGRASAVPQEIAGACVQCGNCCMDKRCVFLEPIADNRFQCGIYHSRFRRFSNCRSFPLNARDIQRYACPSYYVVRFVPKPPHAIHRT
jgi:hypothetical protein